MNKTMTEKYPMLATIERINESGELMSEQHFGLTVYDSNRPLVKIREIIVNYAYEVKRSSEIKYQNAKISRDKEHYQNACTKFKKVLKDIDKRFSELKNKFRGFRKYHARCPYTKEYKKVTVKVNPKALKKDASEVSLKRRKISAANNEAIVVKMRNKITNLVERTMLIEKVPGNYYTKAIMPFKQIYRILFDFGKFKIDKIHQNSEETDIRLVFNLMEFFVKKFGVSQLGEKRLKEFLISLFSHTQNYKVQVYMRFFGLVEGCDYNLSEEKMYLEAYEKIVSGLKNSTVLFKFLGLRIVVPVVLGFLKLFCFSGAFDSVGPPEN